MENNYNYTNVSEETVKAALGTTMVMWDIYSKNDRVEFIKQLINTPDKVTLYTDWHKDLSRDNKYMNQYCNEISDTILDVLFSEFNVVFEILTEMKKLKPEDSDGCAGESIVNYYLNLSEDVRNAINFGYLLSESVKTFLFEKELITDGLGNDGAELFDLAVGKVIRYNKVKTGETIVHDKIGMSEAQVLKYIQENNFNKSEVAPLTREMFMLNTEVFITPSYFRMVQDDYQESSLLPYSFCKKWLEEELINEVEMDGKIVRYPFEDERLTWNQEEVSSLDMLERLAVELDKMEVQCNEAYELILKLKSLTKIA